jgi:hypothetical protein
MEDKDWRPAHLTPQQMEEHRLAAAARLCCSNLETAYRDRLGSLFKRQDQTAG